MRREGGYSLVSGAAGRRATREEKAGEVEKGSTVTDTAGFDASLASTVNCAAPSRSFSSGARR